MPLTKVGLKIIHRDFARVTKIARCKECNKIKGVNKLCYCLQCWELMELQNEG